MFLLKPLGAIVGARGAAQADGFIGALDFRLSDDDLACARDLFKACGAAADLVNLN